MHAAVLDHTNLMGGYDIHLEWSPTDTEPGYRPADDVNTGASIFTAIQEQLGLKLESRKIPMDTIVIDSAEKPEANVAAAILLVFGL